MSFEFISLEEYIEHGVAARKSIDLKLISELSYELYRRLMKGGKLIAFGNGGSAADAQHFAAEVAGKFVIDRQALPAVALTTNTSSLTAISNDLTYDQVFSRQIHGLTNEHDFVAAFSTSGNSKNVLEAIKTARNQRSVIVGFTGKSGGKMKDMVDYLVTIDSEYTPIIQEGHETAMHMICMELEKRMAKYVSKTDYP